MSAIRTADNAGRIRIGHELAGRRYDVTHQRDGSIILTPVEGGAPPDGGVDYALAADIAYHTDLDPLQQNRNQERLRKALQAGEDADQ